MASLEYVVCNRLLDAEVDEYCEWDGDAYVDVGFFRCPSCGGRRPA